MHIPFSNDSELREVCAPFIGGNEQKYNNWVEEQKALLKWQRTDIALVWTSGKWMRL